MSCGSSGNPSVSPALAVTLFYGEAEAMNSENRLLESHGRSTGVGLRGYSTRMAWKCSPRGQDKALFLHSCDSDRWLGESELYLVGTWLQSLMLQGDFSAILQARLSRIWVFSIISEEGHEEGRTFSCLTCLSEHLRKFDIGSCASS